MQKPKTNHTLWLIVAILAGVVLGGIVMLVWSMFSITTISD